MRRRWGLVYDPVDVGKLKFPNENLAQGGGDGLISYVEIRCKNHQQKKI